jgi:hypothetical protein
MAIGISAQLRDDAARILQPPLLDTPKIA